MIFVVEFYWAPYLPGSPSRYWFNSNGVVESAVSGKLLKFWWPFPTQMRAKKAKIHLGTKKYAIMSKSALTCQLSDGTLDAPQT